MAVLAVDFGTSNTAAAVLDGGAVRRLSIEAGADTLPTAVFFPPRGAMRIGQGAAEALIDGEEGRYMRALKSVLGTPLLHEARLIGGKRRSLSEVITAFLSVLKDRAEAQTGQRFTRVLSGRPVHFHTNDPEKDAQAEADLRACYRAAGFETVDFLPEPEAAARASQGPNGETGLIVDIGGGTSDFTLFRRGAAIEVLASHGVRLGGTDFDQAISLAHVMPEFGLGGQLTRTLADGLLPVPRAIYVDLATWAMIPFLYTAEVRRMVDDLVAHAVDRPRLARLQSVLRDELGHDVAFAVEAGKIAANGGPRGEIGLGLVEAGLSVPVTTGSMNAALGQAREELIRAVYDTLSLAAVPPAGVDHVILVGGSSLMGVVSDVMTQICPAARISRAEAFTAVVDGLALATGD
ncbi:Hsp70 family protein [Pseudooceanicola onchidii]|uniref:Hsp70 family protein n=1 Tax=Pseudooceanicola onchidii TaxID=2562279 RepID=UPI0010A9BDDF|nr:Hsp70 family protein [Pseudooceanicola onchidii]